MLILAAFAFFWVLSFKSSGAFSLGIADLLHQCVMRSHVTPLYGYYPAVAVMIHNQLSQVEKPVIEWPKSVQRCRASQMEKMEILKSWNAKITPDISRHLSPRSFLEDTLSPLLHILSPPTLRPVAVHLLSENEKNDLAQLVNKLLAYNFSFKNVKSHFSNSRPEGALDAVLLSFDPPIEDFVTFKEYTPIRYELPSATKQVLIHEVEKQRILHGCVGIFIPRNASCDRKNDYVGLGARANPSIEAFTEHRTERTSDKSDTLVHEPGVCKNSSSSASDRCNVAVGYIRPSGAMKKPKNSFSFFDSFKKSNSNASPKFDCSSQNPTTMERDSRPLLLKYNEGFTNAVKRPVRTREFLI